MLVRCIYKGGVVACRHPVLVVWRPQRTIHQMEVITGPYQHMSCAGVHICLFYGIQDLRLRQWGYGWPQLPQSRLQYIVQIKNAWVIQSIRWVHDRGE